MAGVTRILLDMAVVLVVRGAARRRRHASLGGDRRPKPSRPEGFRHTRGGCVTAGFSMTLPVDAKVYVAGHRGLVGSAIWRHLEQRGSTRLIGRASSELDL